MFFVHRLGGSAPKPPEFYALGQWACCLPDSDRVKALRPHAARRQKPLWQPPPLRLLSSRAVSCGRCHSVNPIRLGASHLRHFPKQILFCSGGVLFCSGTVLFCSGPDSNFNHPPKSPNQMTYTTSFGRTIVDTTKKSGKFLSSEIPADSLRGKPGTSTQTENEKYHSPSPATPIL